MWYFSWLIYIIMLITCSNDLSPASLPHDIKSVNINSLTSGLLHRTLSVPGILFSDAQHFTTSTSGTTIATMHDWNWIKVNNKSTFSNSKTLKLKLCQTNLQRFSIDKNLLNVLRPQINAFNFFRNNILPLGKFEYVFASVYNFQCTILKNISLLKIINKTFETIEYSLVAKCLRRLCDAIHQHQLFLRFFQDPCNILWKHWDLWHIPHRFLMQHNIPFLERPLTSGIN